MLHVATKHLVQIAHVEKLAIVTEDIKGISRGINRKGRALRRRLNLLCRGKIRFMISYKARWLGIPILRDADANPKTCPICGEARALKGWRSIAGNAVVAPTI